MGINCKNTGQNPGLICLSNRRGQKTFNKMKDKIIEQKLYEYVEAVKPDKEILAPAILALSQIRQNAPNVITKKPAWRLPLFASLGSFASACVIALVIFLGIYHFILQPPPSGNAPDASLPPQTFTMNDLTYSLAVLSDVKDDILVIDKENTYSNVRKYSFDEAEDDSVVVISVLYRTVGINGLDQILVIADKHGGLKDFNDFRNFSIVTIEGVTVRRRQQFINGEWYTDAFFEYGGIDYYIRIESSAQNMLVHYIELLLG